MVATEDSHWRLVSAKGTNDVTDFARFQSCSRRARLQFLRLLQRRNHTTSTFVEQLGIPRSITSVDPSEMSDVSDLCVSSRCGACNKDLRTRLFTWKECESRQAPVAKGMHGIPNGRRAVELPHKRKKSSLEFLLDSEQRHCRP